MTAQQSALKTVMLFFGMSAKEMMVEWKALTDKDKKEITDGITNGSLTY